MKIRLIMIGLVVAGLALLLYLIPYCQTIYALADRDLEIVFVVTDAETGEPISNASIDLMVEERKEKGFEQQVIKLVTGNEGKAMFVHKNNSCEDIISPFRKTVTLIDLTWASVNASAQGYSLVEQMCTYGQVRQSKVTFPMVVSSELSLACHSTSASIIRRCPSLEPRRGERRGVSPPVGVLTGGLMPRRSPFIAAALAKGKDAADN